MKKIILQLLWWAWLFHSCNGKQRETEKTTNKTENKMKTIHLSKSDFLTKVANYETTPNEWKYLGDKPAIVDFMLRGADRGKPLLPILKS